MALNLGALAGGFAGGFVTGSKLKMENEREKRAADEHDTKQKIAQYTLKDLERAQPIKDKETQLRGAQLDFQQGEQSFRQSMQDFEQGTRRLLSQGARTQAQTAVNAAGAAAERQPDELALARNDLSARIGDAVQRQAATVWNVLKMGDTARARKMLNDSQLLIPGERVSDFKLEDLEVPDGKGGKTRAKFMTMIPESPGAPPKRIPVAQLEALSNRYGAKYEKVGNSLVRVDANGTATPLYESEQYMSVPENSSVVSKRTGLPPAGAAAGGVMPSPSAARKETTHQDTRVKMAIDKVILPKYGGRFEGGMFFPDEKNKDVAVRAITIAGELVRAGMAPEAAGAEAINRAEREKALGTVAPSSSGYSGPTPWRK